MDFDLNKLLDREPVKVDLTDSLKFLKNKRILITGAGGSIGSELCRQMLFAGAKRLFLFGHGEDSIYHLLNELTLIQEKNIEYKTALVPVIGEIQDQKFMEFIIRRLKCDVIFHTAAHKHVPLSEENPVECIKNNVFGTKNLIDATKNSNISKFIFISCLDEKTRIYTNEGFKYWNEIKSGMTTLSLNKNGEIEEKEIIETTNQNYRGTLFHLKNKSVDIFLTKNHKFLLSAPNNSKKIIIEEAKKVSERSIASLVKGNWIGKNDNNFYIPPALDILRHPDKNYIPVVKTEDFLYILGIFIGDGFLNEDGNGGSIFLDIPEKDKARKKVEKALSRMKINYKSYKGKSGEHIYFSSRSIAKIFKECGKHAINKTIPKWALEYSPNLLEKLLEGLVDSDGHRINTGKKIEEKLTSISFPLMEKCSELASKLNMYFTITVQKKCRSILKDNREIISKNITYIGIFSNSHIRSFRKDNWKEEEYEGEIWCANIKDNHNFLAERNGKLFFTGNSDKAVEPTCIYGVSKNLSERIVLSAGKEDHRFVVVRFGNVIGSKGSIIPLWIKQIEACGPITITHPEVKRFFMSIMEAVALIIKIVGNGKGGELYVLNMGEQVLIKELIAKLTKQACLEIEKDIEIEYIGLRAGEKLEERLWSEEEETSETAEFEKRIFKITKKKKEEDVYGELYSLLQQLYPVCFFCAGNEKEFRNRFILRTLLKKYYPNLEMPRNYAKIY